MIKIIKAFLFGEPRRGEPIGEPTTRVITPNGIPFEDWEKNWSKHLNNNI
jgi:hypothetical protein